MTLVLVNPHAQGGRVRRLLPALREVANERIPFARVQAPERLDEALDILRRERAGSHVVLVGGDGTFNRWLPALLEQALVVSLVPLGSGNDLARALGLQRRDWRLALAEALHAPAQRQAMDTGLAIWSDVHGDTHRTHFVSSLTAGFDSAVALRALEGPAWLRGLPRYLWATLAEWRRLQHWTTCISADGHTLAEGPMLFTSVLNTPTYGSGLPAVPNARPDDGQLDWLRAGPFGRSGTLAMLPRLALGTHLRHPMVHSGRFTTLDIRCDTAIPLAADGEWLGLARQLNVKVQPASLQVLRSHH